MKDIRFFVVAAVLVMSAAGTAVAQSTTADPTTGFTATSSYRLSVSDTVGIAVRDEGELAATQKIDERGMLRLPLLNEVSLAGKTVREAEHYIETLYKEQEFLKQPHVTISVVGFAPRELSVLGEVAGRGVYKFPPETIELDIVDLITKMGGFTPNARQNNVEVTRLGPDGRETTQIVNVEEMMSNKGRGGQNRKEFRVYPGDRIMVRTKLF